jgi:hypothetical protein
MEEIYKGHTINSTGLLDAETHRWWSLLIVLCPLEPGRVRRSRQKPEMNKSFRSEKAAEREGVAFAKKWIDEGKPAQKRPMITTRSAH